MGNSNQYASETSDTMKIKVSVITNEENTIKELSSIKNGDPGLSIGESQQIPGFVDGTLWEIAAVVGNFSVSVAAGIVANWITGAISKKKPETHIHVTLHVDGKEVDVALEDVQQEKLAAAISSLVPDANPDR